MWSGHTGKLKTSKIPREEQKLQETSEKDVWKDLMMEFVEIESQGQTDGSKKVKPFPSTTYFISEDTQPIKTPDFHVY